MTYNQCTIIAGEWAA